MEDFLPFITGDYSIGLLSKDSDDIYHSIYGALTESYEKFIEPLNLSEFSKHKNNLNILDVCFGIGYNTKILMNEYKKLKLKNKLNIDCVDNNKNLFFISPFLKSKISILDRIFQKDCLIKNILNYKDNIYENVKFKNNKNVKLNESINYIILNSLIDKFDLTEIYDFIKNISNQKQNNVFFDKSMLKIIENLVKNRIYLYKNQNKSTDLHNIYYRNISKRDKFVNFSSNISLNLYDMDARTYITDTTKIYDIILLDGFTPMKCPTVWSYEFIKELFNHISHNGLLVTYNTSVITRSTLLSAGFHIGCIIKKDKVIGTIASKNNSYIKNKLSEKEIGLLFTKAGIPFRDKNLNLTNDVILKNRDIEVEQSNLETSSKYLKRTGL